MNEQLQNRYLRHLRAERCDPDGNYLRSLIRSHLHRFPFENISKFHYWRHNGTSGLQWLPTLETFLDHHAGKGWGGNCYILNVHFGWLLQSLGFPTELVRATGGNAHLALMVTVDRRSYYVDVGYGAPLFEPISLEEQPRFTRFGEEVEIMKLDPVHYMIDRRMNGNSFVAKTIEWKPVAIDSFDEVITHSLRDEDDNPFMRRIIATRYTPDTCYSAVNQRLTVKTDDTIEVHEYTRQSEWLDMMRLTFGFDPEDMRVALRFVEKRGVRLFFR